MPSDKEKYPSGSGQSKEIGAVVVTDGSRVEATQKINRFNLIELNLTHLINVLVQFTLDGDLHRNESGSNTAPPGQV